MSSRDSRETQGSSGGGSATATSNAENVLRIAQRNVSVTYWINIFFVIGYTVTFGPIFDLYVYTLAPEDKKNETVGFLESVSGVTSLVVFLPVAYLVDSERWFLKARANLLHRTDFLLIVSTALLAVGIWFDNFNVLFASLVLNGLFYELFNSASEALFADSALITGKRDELYVQRQSATALAAGMGPLLTLVGTLANNYYKKSKQPHGPVDMAIDMGEDTTDLELGTVKAGGFMMGLPESTAHMTHVSHVESARSLMESTTKSNVFHFNDYASPSPLFSSYMGNSRLFAGAQCPNPGYHGGLLPGGALRDDDGSQWSLGFMHVVLLSGLALFLPVVRWMRQYKDLPGNMPSASQRGSSRGRSRSSTSSSANNSGTFTGAGNAVPVVPTSADDWDQNRSAMLQDVTNTHNQAATNAGGVIYATDGYAEAREIRRTEAGYQPRGASEVESRGRSTERNGNRSSSGPAMKTHEELEQETQSRLSRGQKWVPYLCGANDFIVSIGAGMTVKFFNLFFIQEYGFGPISICALQCVYPIVIALFMQILGFLGRRFGRAQVSFTSFFLNAGMFFLLSVVENEWWLLAIFLVRGGLANGVNPLDRSIIMDFTPSNERGKWNAVESFTSLTWSGSAFIGGYISDNHDYRTTFRITGMFYMGALVVFYTPLLFLVPRAPSLTEHFGISKTKDSDNTPSIGEGEPVSIGPL